MKAMVYTAPLELKILDVEEPKPAPGEVIVEVAAVGICGSELEGFSTQSPRRKPPLIMGHEFSGRVVETGEDVEGIEAGQRVAVNPLITCGRCDLCRMGRNNACPNRRLTGMHRPGGFAERVAVPAGQLYPLSDDFSYERASMIEPLANGVHVARLANDPLARNVCVFGAGTIGILAAQAAKLLGSVNILMVDVNDTRLALARSGPTADETVNTKTQDLMEAAKEFTGGRMFDYSVDAVGMSVTRKGAADVLRPGGTAVWIGLHSDETILSGMGAVLNENRIQGSYGYTSQDFGKAFQLLESGAIEIESWSRSFPLDEGVGTFTDLLGGQTAHVKAILQPCIHDNCLRPLHPG
ncbi:MAG: galactitol-1-phosphate 5-dehydrogenase [Armatimonadetes bacterium]|nr:galactitol-1-phosphate 5-dehydrogenase [Armatimonadota bacterium]